MTQHLGAAKESDRMWSGFAEFDPLADASVAGGDQVPSGKGLRAIAAGAPAISADAPASEKIARLFDVMSARRRVLLGVLRFALEPRTPEELRRHVVDLQAHDFSVYSSADYTRQLEQAGALCKVDGAGVPLGLGLKRVPEIVIGDDGREYYKPANPPELFWQTTGEGRNYLESDDPLARLARIVGGDPEHAQIYRLVLEMCDADGGCATDAIAQAVDADPRVQEPRRYAPYFTERLERCDALRWQGAWRTTDFGRQAIDSGLFG